MKVTIKLEGTDAAKRVLRRLAKEYPRATGAALREEAYTIFAESQKQVPVDTGRLRASGYVDPPRHTAGGVEVEIGYTADYAVPVHERLDVRHESPTKAKFLEDPIKEAADGFADRLARRIRKRVE